MSIEKDLLDRSGSVCELCGASDGLEAIEVAPKDEKIVVCSTCKEQIEDESKMDSNHFRCLNDSMWSETPAVQVVAYRLLKNLSIDEGWAQDLVEMMYLEPETLEWAEAGLATGEVVKDSNGVTLKSGDSVTIIKDLDVKGAGFTAKRGTVVKGISLGDDPTHIEGKVNGVRIFLKTCFLKKS
jgi:protein PhnA